MAALDTQIGGDHYKKVAIQPFQLAYDVAKGDAGFCNIAKYLLREKEEPLLQYQKVGHYIELVSELPVRPIFIEPWERISEAHRDLLFKFSNQCNFPQFVFEILMQYYLGNLVSARNLVNELIDELHKSQ